MRGSTALETTFEVILGLQRPGLRRAGKAAFVTEFTKFRRDGGVNLEPRTWELGPDGWTIKDQDFEDPKDDPVVKALRSLESVTQDEIAVRLGINKGTVSRRLEKAKARGALTDWQVKDCFEKARKARHESDLEGLEVEEAGDLTW